jgi:very-short-patch-repair endonuclease
VGHVSGQYDGKRSPHSRGRWDAAIGALAGRQHGAVSLGQLLELGLTREAVEGRVRAKRLLALHRGVYAVGHVALTRDSHFIAAVYACGPGALLSHRAAGLLRGLLRYAGAIDVTAPRSRRPRDGITVHRSRLIHPHDRATVDGIPTTSVARTLVDLADVIDERQLAKAVDRAEVLRVFDLTAIEEALARLPGRRGRHRLKRVLAAYQPEPHFLRSQAERRIKQLCGRHHLPQPQFNVNLAGYEVDVYWPEARLVIEFDGAETHHTRHAFHADRRRDRALATEGIQTLRVTWPDLDARLMEQVRKILRRR